MMPMSWNHRFEVTLNIIEKQGGACGQKDVGACRRGGNIVIPPAERQPAAATAVKAATRTLSGQVGAS